MSEVDVKTMNGASVQKSIVEELEKRGFAPVGKSGMYLKKINEPKQGNIKVNVNKRVAMFQTEDDAFETYDEVPELAEVQALLNPAKTIEQANAEAHEKYGKRSEEDYEKQSIGQAMKERMGAPAKDSPSSPARNLPGVPAKQGSHVAKKNISFGIDWQGLPKEAVIDMGGKPYITKAGLSFVGMKLGVKTVRVEPVRWSFEKQPDGQQIAIARATVTMDDGREYVDYGIAHKDNCTSMISQGGNLDHMASTRASNRALRLATACGYCSVEELPEPPQDVIDAEFSEAD